MKADRVLFDTVRAERGRRAAAGWSKAARAALAGTTLAGIASGIVAAALWLAWIFAEIVP